MQELFKKIPLSIPVKNLEKINKLDDNQGGWGDCFIDNMYTKQTTVNNRRLSNKEQKK